MPGFTLESGLIPMTRFRFLIHIFAVFFVPLMAATAGNAQTISREAMLEELKSRAGLTEADLRNLADGKVVIKELERKVKREVAFVGIVRVEFAFDLAKDGLARTVSTQRRDSATVSGRFSNPPVLSDLDSLEFEAKDLSELQDCRVGDCEWNLPESTIARLGSEVAWNSPASSSQASAILKKAILGYIDSYRKEGGRGLPVYRDAQIVVDLREEYEDLVSDLMVVDAFDKGFGDYVRDYPDGKPLDTRDVFNWTEVKIGFKPVVMVTHTMALERGSADSGMALSVSKQIFANHFFDSSLGITALFGFPATEGRPESYFILVNRSRAGALRGKLGGLLRGLIEDQAKGKIESFLTDAKRYTALASANRAADAEREAFREAEENTWLSDGRIWILIAAGLILVVIVIVLLLRRKAE